jgi:hypothetical protein
LPGCDEWLPTVVIFDRRAFVIDPVVDRRCELGVCDGNVAFASLLEFQGSIGLRSMADIKVHCPALIVVDVPEIERTYASGSQSSVPQEAEKDVFS